jgi:hypothetical protein
MQDIRHARRWRCGEKLTSLIFSDLALVEGPASVNQSADTDDRQSDDQRILSFSVPHNEMSSENLLGLLRRRAASLMNDVGDPR